MNVVDLTQDSDGDEPMADRKRAVPSPRVEVSDSEPESGSESEPDGKSERKAKRKAGSKSKPAASGGLQRKGGKRKGKRKPGKAIVGGRNRHSRFWNFTVFPGESSLLSATERDGLGGNDADWKDWDPLELWICERAATLGDPERVRYAVLGREQCPETGRWHLQGYLECAQKAATTLGGLKLRLEDDTVHAEQVTISRKGARDYAMKDGTYVEFGTWVEGGQGTRSDLNDVAEMVLEGWSLGRIASEAGPQFIRYGKGIEKMMLLTQKPPERDEIKVYVYWGKPGTGKTKRVREIVKKLGKPYFWHTVDKDWFDGYDGEEVVVIDDFNSQISYELFLQILDRYAVTVPTKGGHVAWRARTIYITSNLHPSEWYLGRGYNVGQIARRITCTRKVKSSRVSEVDGASLNWHDGSDVDSDEENAGEDSN